MTKRLLPLLAAGLLTLNACGAGDDGSTSDPAPAVSTAPSTSDGPADTASDSGDAAAPTVTISDSRFDQTELRVEAGATVVFSNTDPYAHTVTSAAGSTLEFDSGEFREGETFEVTFDEPGEYAYFCQIHPTMRAKVIVG